MKSDFCFGQQKVFIKGDFTMKDKKGKSQADGISAFSDISLGGMNKYIGRNAEAHKLKRIAELDERIRQFASRKKDAEWIKEAPEFCERETLANKDIISESKEAYRLPLIKEEAEKLRRLELDGAAAKEKERLAKIQADEKARLAQIEADNKARMAQMAADAARQAEADRLANEAKVAKAKADAEATRVLREREAEAAKLAEERREREEREKLARIASEAEEKALREKIELQRIAEKKRLDAEIHKKEIREKAEKGDELVAMLVASPRSKFWCGEVERAREEISSYPREAMILMRRLPELEEIAEEAKALQRGIVLDQRISRLATSKKRDEAWADEVLACESELASVGEDNTKGENSLYTLVPEAKRIKYDGYIKPYEKLIKEFIGINPKNVTEAHCKKFEELNENISELEFDISEFIGDFENKWSEARTMVYEFYSRRDELNRKIKIDRDRAEKAAAEKAEREKAEKRARAEEDARCKIAEEYRLLLETVESGSFDSHISEFEAFDKKRSSLDFSLSERIEDFEKRMVAARQAVNARAAEIAEEENRRKAEAKRAKEKEKREAEAEKKRRARRAAIRNNLRIIISLAAVILLSAAGIVCAILFAEQRMLFIAAIVFVTVGFFTELFKPIALKSLPNMAETIIVKSAVFAASLVTMIIPATRYVGIALGATLVLSAVELTLNLMAENDMLEAKSWYKKDDFMPSFFANMAAIACGISAVCIGFGVIVAAASFAKGLIIAVAGSMAAYLALTITVLVIIGNEGGHNFAFVAVDVALVLASLTLIFISRSCVLTGIAVGIATVVHLLAFAITATALEYYESWWVMLWSAFIFEILVVAFALLMYFKFWGKADYVVSEDGTLVGVFVHDGKETLEIPRELNGVEITTIGYNCFDRISMKTGIWRCRIKTVILPETVKTIDNYAFKNCNIPTVVLNYGLKKINARAFSYAYTTKLGAPDGIEQASDENYIPDTVTYIGENAFFDADLQGKLVLPEGVDAINDYTFSWTVLREVEAKGVKTVGGSSFSYAGLTKITFGEALESIGTGSFYNCKKLKTVELEQGLVSIGEDAFRNCESLEKIELPQTLKKIGNVSFGGCTSLSMLDVSMVETVGTEAFKNASERFDVYFGKSLKNLGSNAFLGITSGLTVHYEGSESEWNENVNINTNYNLKFKFNSVPEA